MRLACDKLLTANDSDGGSLSKSRLLSLKGRLHGATSAADNVPDPVKKHHTHQGNSNNGVIKSALLSPHRACSAAAPGTLSCCAGCAKVLGNDKKPHEVWLPKFAASNGVALGEAPKELKCLSEARASSCLPPKCA